MNTLKVLSSCTTSIPNASIFMLNLKSLAYIFPIFAQKALKSKDPEEQKSTVSTTLAILYNMILNLDDLGRKRILAKFKEKKHKNSKKLLDYRAEYSEGVGLIATDKKLILDALKLEEGSEEARRVLREKKMENGLMELWYIQFMVMWMMAIDKEANNYFQIVLGIDKLKEVRQSVIEFVNTLEGEFKQKVEGILTEVLSDKEIM